MKVSEVIKILSFCQDMENTEVFVYGEKDEFVPLTSLERRAFKKISSTGEKKKIYKYVFTESEKAND
ncbi:MAG: hypothetical protein PHN69_02895 [Candidatus Pacebacteria bacterium]|jgi:predicted PilT family ATPase|nr:hypothetical protein [Candidatus Paceibacterota bacterium]